MVQGSKRPQRAARRSDAVERIVVERILDDTYPPGSRLPLERELAAELGVGRPTLREAIQRLERDGWLTVRKAVGTVVNDYWSEGSFNILPAMVAHDVGRLTEVMGWLAELRVGLAPLYVRQAVERSPARVVATLVDHESLPDEAEAFAAFDTRWQIELAELASNPLFHLFNQSFRDTYPGAAAAYFAVAEHREASRRFYETLMAAAMDSDGEAAELATRRAMEGALERIRRTDERTAT